MSSTKKTTRILIALAVISVVFVLGWITWSPRNSAPPSDVSASKSGSADSKKIDSESTSDQRPPSRESSAVQLASLPFAQYDKLPEGYVGTKACASCHAGRHESYLRTHHSRSLREVDLATEEHGETLHHPRSNRSYDIVSKHGQLWHREWRQFSDDPGDKFQVNELPVCYVMGSGAFAKGYLLADGDYLLQSPVTWYVGADDFGIAPGYDQREHRGFTRVISDECLFCHAGLVSQRNGNSRQPAIHELSIGCERCHGPGEAHADLYRSVDSGQLKASTAELDPKIVNPAKLERRQAESVCGQCHLQGDVIAHAAGTEIWDFVVGEDLARTRVHYKGDPPGDFKKVFTNHFDQMWQSPCYQNSETLTCITCHDSHPTETVSDTVQRRRDQCNECHAEQGCALPMDERIAREQNDCIKCHMPVIGSEIPHTSTTSHIIAVYESGKPRGIQTSGIAKLRRVQRSTSLSQQELARRDVLGESYWTIFQARLGNSKPLESFDRRDDLRELLRSDRSDAEIHSLLARLARATAELTGESAENQEKLDALWSDAAEYATKSLALEPRPVMSREAALEVLGTHLMRADDFSNAVDCFSELTQIRRSAVDWYNLGLCLARVRRLADAEQALRQAIRIDGTYAAPYRSLAILYRTIDPATSQQLEQMSIRLMRRSQN